MKNSFWLMTIAVVVLPTEALTQTANPIISKLPNEVYLKDGTDIPSDLKSSSKLKSLDILNKNVDRTLGSPKTAPQFESMARDFINKNAVTLGLNNNAAALVLKNVRSSLTGTVVDYEQQLNGIPIVDSRLGVSVDQKGDISSVTKNIYSVPTEKNASIPKEPKVTEAEALDILTMDLKPSGKVIEAPTITKAYLNENNVLTLVYILKVAVQQPFGYWEYRVDAQSGRIIEKFDRRIKEGKRLDPAAVESAVSLPRVDLKQAFQNVTHTAKMATAGKIVTAKALVFDPNPVTSLNDSTLKDDSNSESFKPAYVKIDLLDVTQSGEQLLLTGPTVRIEDFEPGEGGQSRAPSIATGEWTATRGNNAFNDVMTYYFLSQSIVYLRKLGYQGLAELFPQGIAADSDGDNGADNSHYVPGSDVLAFGHGCVDDNEDTDVILHELGHAIHTHINPSWSGGDSGAIGEGFGDYWAVSYRMKLGHGTNPDPGKVFPWDGIDACWGGRRADVVNAMYDPSRTYDAHKPVDGFISDELWSTPLVQSLNELKSKGENIESIDKVVLEGMFNMGPNFTMRTLAANTVLKAKELFPDGEIASVFEKRFKEHNILP